MKIRTLLIIIFILISFLINSCSNDIVNFEYTQSQETQEENIELEEGASYIEPIKRNNFDNVKFFSIPEEDKEYYLKIINSFDEKYIKGLAEIRIYGKKIYQHDGNYFYENNYCWIRTNCDKGNFKFGLIHELTHHNVYIQEGKMTDDNYYHYENFINMQQEIISNLK